MRDLPRKFDCPCGWSQSQPSTRAQCLRKGRRIEWRLLVHALLNLYSSRPASQKILVQAKASFKPKWAYHISRHGAWDILKLRSDSRSVMRKMRPKRTPRPNPCAQFSTLNCKIYNRGPRTQTTRPTIIWGTDQEDAWRTAPIMAQTLPRTMQYRRPSTIPNIITVSEPTAAARV